MSSCYWDLIRAWLNWRFRSFCWQGVSRALADNSKTFRLPTYLHERLIAIRGAKYALEDQGIAPTVEVRGLYRWNFWLVSSTYFCKFITFFVIWLHVCIFFKKQTQLSDVFLQHFLVVSEHRRVTEYISKESTQCYRGRTSLYYLVESHWTMLFDNSAILKTHSSCCKCRLWTRSFHWINRHFRP